MRRTLRQRLAWSSVAFETVEQARLYRLRAGGQQKPAERGLGATGANAPDLQEQSSKLDSTAGVRMEGRATPSMARRYRGGTDQYLPSNAKIGLRRFHAPAVKSGNSSVWKPLAIDCSDSGVIALQVTAS